MPLPLQLFLLLMLLMLLMLRLHAASPADSSIPSSVCPAGWLSFNASCYRAVRSAGKNFSDARAACRAMGADLLWLESQEELDWAVSPGRFGMSSAWIGLHRDSGGSWLWVNSVNQLLPSIKKDVDSETSRRETSSPNHFGAAISYASAQPTVTIVSLPSQTQLKLAICKTLAPLRTMTTICPSADWLEFDDHCYQLVKGSGRTYEQALADCPGRDSTAHLLWVTSEAEQAWIFDKAARKWNLTEDYKEQCGNCTSGLSAAWTGLFRDVADDQFKWTRDSSVLSVKIKWWLTGPDKPPRNTAYLTDTPSGFFWRTSLTSDRLFHFCKMPKFVRTTPGPTSTTLRTTRESRTDHSITEYRTTINASTAGTSTGNSITEYQSTGHPTSEHPSTELPTSEHPLTQHPSTELPTSEHLSTQLPSSERQTSEHPSTQHPSTELPTSEHPSTQHPSTELPTSEHPSTELPTSEHLSTQHPSTELPTSEHLSTQHQSTELPTSKHPSTQLPSSERQTSEHPSTQHPSTELPTSEHISTQLPSSELPTSEHLSTELPTSEHRSTKHPSTKHTTTERLTSEHPSTERQTSEHSSAELPTSEHSSIDHPTTVSANQSSTLLASRQRTDAIVTTIRTPERGSTSGSQPTSDASNTPTSADLPGRSTESATGHTAETRQTGQTTPDRRQLGEQSRGFVQTPSGVAAIAVSVILSAAGLCTLVLAALLSANSSFSSALAGATARVSPGVPDDKDGAALDMLVIAKAV